MPWFRPVVSCPGAWGREGLAHRGHVAAVHCCCVSRFIPFILSQDALQQRLKLLTNEKAELQSHLMDCRVGIEEEGKVREGVWFCLWNDLDKAAWAQDYKDGRGVRRMGLWVNGRPADRV